MDVADLRRRMQARQRIHLVNVNYPSPSLAVKLTQCGFDAIFIDCEHGAYSIDQVAAISSAVTAAGGVPIVRPEANVDWLIKRYLNVGALGICAPAIATATDVAELLHAVRDTETGRRGNVLTLCILESKTALDNLHALCDGKDVDAWMLGPVDLARSVGLDYRTDRAAVDALMEQAFRNLQGKAMTYGTRATPANAGSLAHNGCSVFYWHANDLIEVGINATIRA